VAYELLCNEHISHVIMLYDLVAYVEKRLWENKIRDW